MSSLERPRITEFNLEAIPTELQAHAWSNYLIEIANGASKKEAMESLRNELKRCENHTDDIVNLPHFGDVNDPDTAKTIQSAAQALKDFLKNPDSLEKVARNEHLPGIRKILAEKLENDVRLQLIFTSDKKLSFLQKQKIRSIYRKVRTLSRQLDNSEQIEEAIQFFKESLVFLQDINKIDRE